MRKFDFLGVTRPTEAARDSRQVRYLFFNLFKSKQIFDSI
jgi:hypothetical protein